MTANLVKQKSYISLNLLYLQSFTRRFELERLGEGAPAVLVHRPQPHLVDGVGDETGEHHAVRVVLRASNANFASTINYLIAI